MERLTRLALGAALMESTSRTLPVRGPWDIPQGWASVGYVKQ